MTAQTQERGAPAVGRGRDKPILFSAPMVRALIREAREPGTGKRQTRRIVKLGPMHGGRRYAIHPPEELIELEPGEYRRGICHYLSTDALSGPYKLPYAVGDRLWVREAWRSAIGLDKSNAAKMAEQCAEAGYCRTWAPIAYEADGARTNWGTGWDNALGRYRHARFMPRWASRLSLIVTEVRVERLNAISEADAAAEGVRQVAKPDKDGGRHFAIEDGDPTAKTAVRAFRDLWSRLHGPDTWAANPWIVAVTFRPLLANIDALPPEPERGRPAPSGGATFSPSASE